MRTPISSFVYFVVSEGNAPLLKEEIQREYPDLRLAYSRSQFLTYKLAAPAVHPSQDFGVVFAYSSGFSLGRSNRVNLINQIEECLKNPVFAGQSGSQGSKAKPIFNSFLCRELDSEIRKTFEGRFKTGPFSDSDLVLELVKSHDDEYYLGVHPFGPHRTLLNDYFDPPVPSRSYHKIREAFRLLQLTPQKGQTALDLGAAPGGASFYFLENGVKVCAVDPGDMHVLCTSHSLFEHRRIPIDKLGTLQLGTRSFDWIALDINLDPLYLSHELERILELLPSLPKGLFFTVKQTRNFSRERLPEFVRIIKSLGFHQVVTRQVPSNRSEFLLFASPE